MKIKPHHITFLKLACSELSSKEIAAKMNVSQIEIFSYTQYLCQKLKVRGRFGLMLYALKTKIVKPNEIKFERIPGRLTLYEGLEVALRGTVLLEEPELLRENKKKLGGKNERNVQKRLTNY